MPLILAIDPDKRQSTQLAAVVKTQLQAELVHRAAAADALDALKGRVPDLVLTSSLISPREDAALAAHLRDLGAAAAHVQTITIPLLGSAAPERAKGVLAALRREKPQTAMTDGCAPDVFAEQIRQYLRTADEQKAAAAGLAEEPVAEAVFEPAVVADAIAVEAASEPEPEAVAVAGEPERLPLSQLLQIVSDWTTIPGAPTPALEAAPLADEPVQLDAHATEPAAVEAQAAEEWNDEALEELARQLPPPSLADGIPSEAPVPVVEIRTFETLDAIASHFAAAPLPRHESLDDLASLFAATATLPNAGPLTPGLDTQPIGRGHEFESLFAQPSAEPAAPIEVPGVDPSLFAASAPQPPRAEVAVAESVIHEPASVEPVLEQVLAEPALPGFEVLEPAAAEWQQEAAVDRSWAPVAAKPLDEEIALDVDGFDPAVTAPAAAPAAPANTSFSFTFVDGFGDAWSDFDVPSLAAAAPVTAPEPEPAVAPVLDDEALSLIGDAAHQASFDALVIEEFERGGRRSGRKAKPAKTHAGATQVVPAATPAVKKKAPVQDEWGFFDPEQCGFAALDDEESGDRRPARDSNTRVRVISY